MTGLFRWAAALLLPCVVAIAGWLYAGRWHPSPARFPLQGIDLLMAPGPVEWGSVRAAGADFAYLVATQGHRREPSFEANWAALPEAGLRRGAVHLFSLCEPAGTQANAFNVVVPQSADALPAAVDVSYRDDCADRPAPATLLAGLRRFLATVEVHTGKPLLVRVSRAVDADYRLTAALERPVWAMANWFDPAYPARRWRMWRANDLRRVDGVTGPVNWDVVAP